MGAYRRGRERLQTAAEVPSPGFCNLNSPASARAVRYGAEGNIRYPLANIEIKAKADGTAVAKK